MPVDSETWLVEAESAFNRLILGWRPTGTELTGCPSIDNWSVVEALDSTVRLMGSVAGHPNPRVGRGPLTMTSPLIWLAEDLSWARTASRYYFLGRPGASHTSPLSQADRVNIVLRAAAWLERERDWAEN